MTVRPCSCSRLQPLCDTCQVLTAIVPHIRHQLYRYARAYECTLTRDDLDDLTQEVLFGLVRSGRTSEQLRALVACIARRRLIDWIRHAAWRQSREAAGDRIEEEAGRPLVSDRALDVIEAMEGMSDDMRAVFVARGLDGRTRDETVVHLGFSEGKVQHLYMKALAILADVLGIDAS